MEFLAGIISTLVAEFIGYKFFQAHKRKKERVLHKPSPSAPDTRPLKDYPTRNEID